MLTSPHPCLPVGAELLLPQWQTFLPCSLSCSIFLMLLAWCGWVVQWAAGNLPDVNVLSKDVQVVYVIFCWFQVHSDASTSIIHHMPMCVIFPNRGMPILLPRSQRDRGQRSMECTVAGLAPKNKIPNFRRTFSQWMNRNSLGKMYFMDEYSHYD